MKSLLEECLQFLNIKSNMFAFSGCKHAPKNNYDVQQGQLLQQYKLV